MNTKEKETPDKSEFRVYEHLGGQGLIRINRANKIVKSNIFVYFEGYLITELILNKYFKISIKTYINNLLAINDDSNETNDTTSNNNNSTITTNYENINISDSNSKIVRMNGNVEMVQTP